MPKSYQIAIAALLVAPFLLVQALKWIVAPLRIWRKQTVAIRPYWEPTAADELSPELAERVGAAVAAFREVGFEVASNLRNKRAVPGVQGVQVFLVNRASGDTAVILGSWGKLLRST